MSNAELIRNLQEAMQVRSKPAPYDATAVVTRVDGTTAWVRLAGSDTETPIKRTIDAKAGDVVQVRVSGGSAWINGNQSAPPTDDTTAIEAKQKTEAVERTVETTVQTLEKVADVANDAKDTARAGKDIAEATDQYFWADTNGAHVTLTPKGTDPNGATGFNSLWNMLGLLLRNGGNILAQLGQNGIAFYDGRGNADSNVLAQFAASGVRIGKSDGTNIEIAPNKVKLTAENGEEALHMDYMRAIDASDNVDYGVNLTDEHYNSIISLNPASTDGNFDGHLSYTATMGDFEWRYRNKTLISLNEAGFTYTSVSTGATLFNIDPTGEIWVKGQDVFAVHPFVYEQVTVNVSFAAGTIGSRGAAVSLGSTAKSGYAFLDATILSHTNTTQFSVDIVRNSSTNTVSLIAYRATAQAVTDAQVIVRKMWVSSKLTGAAE